MCFLAAWVQKGSQNKPDGSIVEASSTHFGPGGYQRGSEIQQKNRNFQKNSKHENGQLQTLSFLKCSAVFFLNGRTNGFRITIFF
jgi:hypothetical protein